MVGLSTEEDGQNNKSVSSKWGDCRQRKMVKTINLYPLNGRVGQRKIVDRGRWSKQ